MSTRVLVLDQGGHGSRALVFDEEGQVLARASVPVTTIVTKAGWIEQNPDEILASLEEVFRQIVIQIGDAFCEISAAALIVQRSSLIAWDSESRQAISPVISWQDTRNAEWLDSIVHERRNFIRESTGLYANAHFGASKMRWLMDNSPAVQASYSRGSLLILPLASFLHQWLTQSPLPLVDGVIASRTLLTEVASLNWSPALLELFGLHSRVLPTIKPTLSDYGVIHLAGMVVPLRLLGGDQSFFAASYGLGFDCHSVFINAGTGVFIQQKMDQQLIPTELLCSTLSVSECAAETVVVAEGTVNSAASALDWLWQHVGLVYSAADWDSAMQDSDSDSVPFFINRLTATGSPDWLPSGDSSFSRESSSALEAVAVLESIVFSVQRNIDCLARVKVADKIFLSGGLSKIEVFCQCLADLSGMPVWRSDDVEACARGAAMQLLPAMNNQHSYRQYTPKTRSYLSSRYRQWSAAMDQLRCSG